jgi:predicted nucleic acid-binding protein
VKRFILDASVAAAWFIDRPMDPYAEQIRQLLRHDWTAVVPALWQAEVANTFATAERRKFLSLVEVAEACALLQKLRPSRLELDSDAATLEDLAVCARQYGLAAYDATYLLKAIDSSLPLATLDKPLRAAMVKAGVFLAQ